MRIKLKAYYGLIVIVLLIPLYMLINAPHTYSLKELSGGYHLRPAGHHLHDILGSSNQEKDIPADVIAYCFSDDFIIAAQKPEPVDNSVYNQDCVYKLGRSQTYYWIIVHREKRVLGPMVEKEYLETRKRYYIPGDLQLKPVE